MRDVIRVLCFNGLIPYTWSQGRSRSSTMLRRTKGCATARTAAAATTRRTCTEFSVLAAKKSQALVPMKVTPCPSRRRCKRPARTADAGLVCMNTAGPTTFSCAPTAATLRVYDYHSYYTLQNYYEDLVMKQLHWRRILHYLCQHDTQKDTLTIKQDLMASQSYQCAYAQMD